MAQIRNPNAAIPRPRAASLAVQLLWVTVAIGAAGFAYGLLNGHFTGEGQPPVGVLIGIAIFFTVLSSVLITAIARRRNWARWLLLVVVAFGWLSTALDPSSLLVRGYLAVVIEAIITGLEVFALALLFFGQGAQWFKTLE